MNIKKIHWLTYASLISLALGLFTSITFSALHHIFLIIPCIYFLNKTDFRSWPKSAWALLVLIVIIFLSVVVNSDKMVEGYFPLTRTKYYLFGLLSIAPISSYFETLNKEERTIKISQLLYAFLIATTLAGMSGMSGVFFGFNFLKFKFGFSERNGGLAGMLMNYAHNLAFFHIFITGLVLYKNEINKYLNLNFLYGVWIINTFALFTTYTRGAWLAYVVATPFFFVKKNVKSFIVTALFFFLVGTGAYLIAGKAVKRPGSDAERLSQWKTAWVGFKENPVFGLGFMNFEKQCHRIKDTYNIEEKKFCGHAHNNYLEMLASTGILGGIFFIAWQLFWFREMFEQGSLVHKISLPMLVVLVVGGITQATFSLGANLFLIMPWYAISQTKLKQ